MGSAETYGSEEEVVVHARVSVPIVMALEWEADELGRAGTSWDGSSARSFCIRSGSGTLAGLSA